MTELAQLSTNSGKAVARPPVSCFIVAKDEADRIGRTIEFIRDCVSEVVVVDFGSTDGTVEVARKLGATVLSHPWTGYGPQKRYAEEHCRFDWVLNLDADEVATDELRDGLVAAFASGEPPVPAFKLAIVEVYPDRVAPRPFSYVYRVVRLYDRRKVRYSTSLVHDRVLTEDEPVGRLEGRVLHYSVRSLPHQRGKLDAYFRLQMEEKKNRFWTSVLRLPIDYPREFFRYYILRRHMMGGLFGLKLSHVHAGARTRRMLLFLRRATGREDFAQRADETGRR